MFARHVHVKNYHAQYFLKVQLKLCILCHYQGLTNYEYEAVMPDKVFTMAKVMF